MEELITGEREFRLIVMEKRRDKQREETSNKRHKKKLP